jgi:hypothetical protein
MRALAEQQAKLRQQAEEVPGGYEEMTGAYFRSLSESQEEGK